MFKSLLLLFLAATATANSNSPKAPFSLTKSLFGVSRGGGLFGGNKNDEPAEAVAEAERKMYPAMSQEEVEEWLSHIPVFAVTDESGAGVVLKPDQETSVFYFFMNPMMANATLTTLNQANPEMNFRISAFSLGKIWFNILNNKENAEVKLKQPGQEDSEGEVTKGVEYRLVPDTRDLLGARMLLTMDPEDNAELQAAQASGAGINEEAARKALEKAMTAAPKFNATYNEIPIFMIQQMRLQKQPAEGAETPEEPVTMLPMYFNLQEMVALWQQFSAQSEEAKGVEPAINLLDLFEIVEKMQTESEVDFRNCLLVPSKQMYTGGSAAGADSPAASGDDEIKLPGAQTLGDL